MTIRVVRDVCLQQLPLRKKKVEDTHSIRLENTTGCNACWSYWCYRPREALLVCLGINPLCCDETPHRARHYVSPVALFHILPRTFLSCSMVQQQDRNPAAATRDFSARENHGGVVSHRRLPAVASVLLEIFLVQSVILLLIRYGSARGCDRFALCQLVSVPLYPSHYP